MKKLLILLSWIFLCVCGLHAQNIYDYGYDAAGNRVRRRVVTLKTDGDSGTFDNPKADPVSLDDGNVRLYPNPTRGIIVLESLEGEKVVRYRLSDTGGRLIEADNAPGSSLRLDLSPYPAGIYLLEVVLGKERKHYKIVKQ